MENKKGQSADEMEIKRPRDEISVQRVLWGVGGGMGGWTPITMAFT